MYKQRNQKPFLGSFVVILYPTASQMTKIIEIMIGQAKNDTLILLFEFV